VGGGGGRGEGGRGEGGGEEEEEGEKEEEEEESSASSTRHSSWVNSKEASIILLVSKNELYLEGMSCLQWRSVQLPRTWVVKIPLDF